MALAAADIGVSLRNGAQASHHLADVCLAAPGMRPLERFIEGSRTTMGAIRINLAISVAYNASGGVIAFADIVNPLVAAILMPHGGITVLVLALRLPSFDPKSLHGKTSNGTRRYRASRGYFRRCNRSRGVCMGRIERSIRRPRNAPRRAIVDEDPVLRGDAPDK